MFDIEHRIRVAPLTAMADVFRLYSPWPVDGVEFTFVRTDSSMTFRELARHRFFVDHSTLTGIRVRPEDMPLVVNVDTYAWNNRLRRMDRVYLYVRCGDEGPQRIPEEPESDPIAP